MRRRAPAEAHAKHHRPLAQPLPSHPAVLPPFSCRRAADAPSAVALTVPADGGTADSPSITPAPRVRRLSLSGKRGAQLPYPVPVAMTSPTACAAMVAAASLSSPEPWVRTSFAESAGLGGACASVKAVVPIHALCFLTIPCWLSLRRHQPDRSRGSNSSGPSNRIRVWARPCLCRRSAGPTSSPTARAASRTHSGFLQPMLPQVHLLFAGLAHPDRRRQPHLLHTTRFT